MHEFAIGESIVRSMRRIQAENGYPAVHEVTVEIGAHQLVVPDSLEMAFTALTDGTEFEGAVLIQKSVPARALCIDCEVEQERSELFDPCKECGSHNFRMLSGMELNIIEMEVAENV